MRFFWQRRPNEDKSWYNIRLKRYWLYIKFIGVILFIVLSFLQSYYARS